MSCYQDHETNPVAVGPWGGQSGSNWDDGVYSAVRQIVITHGAGIDSIQIEYDKQGYPVWADRHGGTGGYRTDKVKLAYPEEFLTSIHGYYGHLYAGGPVCVRSLTFVSNIKTYGPFGVDQGTYFNLPSTDNKIVGFCGRAGWYLDAIGAYTKPIHQKNEPHAVLYTQSYVANAVDRNSGYSVIQGSLGKEYDIVLAIKQRDNTSRDSPQVKGVYTNAPQEVKGVYTNSPHATPKVKGVYSNSPHATSKVKGVYTNAPRATLSGQSSSSDSSDDDNKEKALVVRPSNGKKLFLAPGVVTHGPWGGSGGTAFDEGSFTGIKQIIISRNVGIVYLKVIYEKDGEVVHGGRYGGTGGYRTDKIVIDYPYEILTHITGYYGSTMISSTIIKSLTFHTTKKKYGPYGDEHGVPFCSKSKEGNQGMIVGFHGKKGLFLDAIGVHVKEGKVTPQVRPAPAPAPHADTKRAIDGDPLWPSKQPLVHKSVSFEEPAMKVVKEPAPFGTGPWGGEGGRPWDDGVYTGIKQIFLTRSEVISSIQIEYDRNGQSVWSVKHGGNTGATVHRVKLEYPHEVLTCITGYYSAVGKDDHGKVLRSLTFNTSRGKYGPFGDEVGTFFTSTTTEGMILGFHGRSSSYLDAIGVHMQHWLGSYKQPKSSFFNMFG